MRGIALIGLWHNLLRYYTILHHKVRNTCKLTSIADRIVQEPIHLAIAERKVASVNNRLQKEIRLLESKKSFAGKNALRQKSYNL